MAAITDEKRKRFSTFAIGRAFQVVFHYENEKVDTLIVRGMNTTEEAEDFFMDQFDEEKHDLPKVLSVIQITE